MATLLELSRGDVAKLSAVSDTASITDFQHLASYNWVETKYPTIAVPGRPPQWSPPPGPLQVPKDFGKYYVAENAARFPEYPIEPLFQALFATKPQFDVKAIDLVTDRNCLRKLLCFVAPRLENRPNESFTICAETIGNTMIFCRKERKSRWTQYIRHDQFQGYGHTFEKKFTLLKKDLSAHQRIIAYHFGGLKFLVAHETDAFVPSKKCNASQELEITSGLLTGLSLAQESNTDISSAGSKLTIRAEGEIIDVADTIEIKTKASKTNSGLSFAKVAAQLWFAQTPKLVRAYHVDGSFQVPEVEDVSVQLSAWEKDNQEGLGSLVALILRIKEVVKSQERAVIRFDHKSGKLTIEKNGGRFPSMLPQALYSRWNATHAIVQASAAADAGPS